MPESMTPRRIADDLVETMADLNPLVAVQLGIRPGDDTMPDFSPDHADEVARVQRSTLAALDAGEAAGSLQPEEARCARLLRERLTAQLAVHEAGEHLRAVSNIGSPMHSLRSIFQMMPTASEQEWAAVARRLRNVPESAKSYQAALAAGSARGMHAGPSRVTAAIGQLEEWTKGDGWYASFVSDAPDELRAELDEAANAATASLAELRGWLAGTYAPAVDGTPEAAGADRYAVTARMWTGSDLDLEDACAWGWAEYRRLEDEIRCEAGRVQPGAEPREAMRHLDEHGEAIEGVEQVRVWLQQLMDTAMSDLDGTHFDLAEPIKTVEAMIAPPGSAAAPYYTRPSLDFSRPGRTWLPTMDETRFPVWDLVSTWSRLLLYPHGSGRQDP